MKQKRLFPIALATLVIALGCAGEACVQEGKAESISFADFVQMLANQPDHMEDRALLINNGVIKIGFARKQGKVRYEFCPMDIGENLTDESFRTYRIVTISEANKPTFALDPQEQTYAEAPEAFTLASFFDLSSFVQRMVKSTGELNTVITRTRAGMIDGHLATKVRLGFKGEKGAINFYFANDLKNLFLKMDADDVKDFKGSCSLSNISFEIPDELFEVPNNYKKIDFNTMISSIKQKAVE
jgi:hypothetical protein